MSLTRLEKAALLDITIWKTLFDGAIHDDHVVLIELMTHHLMISVTQLMPPLCREIPKKVTRGRNKRPQRTLYEACGTVTDQSDILSAPGGSGIGQVVEDLLKTKIPQETFS